MENQHVRKSLYLRQLEALINRLSPHDITEELEKTYGRELSGYVGEKKLPYYLHMIQNEKLMLYGVRLPWQNHFFQIDNLSIFLKKIFICEVKNLKGKLFINEANQLVQEHDDGKLEIYDNPLVQAQFQKEKLEALLRLQSFSFPPIHPIVVFTHPNANLNFQHPDMIPVQQLPLRLSEILRESHTQTFSFSHLKNISHFLSRHHQDRRVDILTRFPIQPRKVKCGLFCPQCNSKAIRIYGTWECIKCGLKDKKMHIYALRDWTLIFGPIITNRQARYFLDLPSKDLIKRILQQMNCPSVGTYSDRKYDLSDLLDLFDP
ncbi:NERD domain-containing protein [Gracilibacillus sp. D59]|uniref:nuclease-related domain-containing protein n=1 Tax=Gracilibacillus sp. D59 TaxID=3457434 RepID=UPI003FCD6ECA